MRDDIQGKVAIMGWYGKGGSLMSIEIIESGSIFDPCDSDIIVCPVNLMGTLGKGLAKEFRNRFPGIWPPYYKKCRADLRWKFGEVLTLSNPSGEFPKWICCFPTKIHYYDSSYLWLIEKGMSGLFDEIVYTGCHAISLPALGCGLGGLKWDIVKKYLLGVPWPTFLHVRIFAPQSPIREDGNIS